MNLSSNLLKISKMSTETVNSSQPKLNVDVSSKKKRDSSNYIKAAKKNQWIKHVKNVGKKKNLSFKDALKICKVKKVNK